MTNSVWVFVTIMNKKNPKKINKIKANKQSVMFQHDGLVKSNKDKINIQPK